MLLFHVFQVGASLYVSNIGSSSFMGIGGAATANGIAVVCYEFTVRYFELVCICSKPPMSVRKHFKQLQLNNFIDVNFVHYYYKIEIL